jgi:hypothetical protein
MVPRAGESDHLTAVFVVLVTEAANWTVPELLRVAVEGLTDTETGGETMIFDATTTGERERLAGTITATTRVDWVAVTEGAVYRPLGEIVPSGGQIANVMLAVLGVREPSTVKLNWKVCPEFKLTDTGLSDVVA